MGITVVCLRDGPESLLTSGVPDLKFDRLIVNLESFDFEIDADCAEV